MKRCCASSTPLLALLFTAGLLQADPGHYRKADTWPETFQQSVAAIDAEKLEVGFEPYVSAVVRGGEPARRVQVDVTGARTLYLQVVGDPDKVWGLGNWGDPVLVDPSGEAHPLTTEGWEANGKPALDWEVLKGRHAINLNLHSGVYGRMRTAGQEFTRGIHVQVDSLIRVPLDGKYVRFETWVGVDDWAKGGNIRFRVLGERAAAVEQLWDLVERDFPSGELRQQMRWERLDDIWSAAWDDWDPGRLADRYVAVAERITPVTPQRVLRLGVADRLENARLVYLAACGFRSHLDQAEAFNAEPLRLAIKDLDESFGMTQAANQYRERLTKLESNRAGVLAHARGAEGSPVDVGRLREWVDEAEGLREEVIFANPLLDFDQLLVVKRRPLGDPRRSQWDDKGLGEFLGLPRQSSWGLGTMPVVDDWENDLAVLSPVRPNGALRTVYRSGDRRLITDVDLAWSGDRLTFSMPDEDLQWQVHELTLGDATARQLTPSVGPGVHNYDSVYLPNGRIAFISTAPLQGVPCNSGVIVGMMYEMEADGSNIHQVCFEQDHNYTPSVLNSGRILYLRWDYTDTPHVWNRLLMSMNPDGTGQMEYYGSGSYWPNAVFFARAIPGHPSKIAGIVTGHHEGRVGELVVFDPARGRHEAEGVVQRIPGRGKPVEPVIEDKPTEHSWPKFLHPWPLNENYFLVAGKPHQDALWGIYLVDTFDNITLLHERDGYALFEPIPLRARPRPPIIPDKAQPDFDRAIVYLEDIYQGPGLAGVPRGTVKQLRVFTYHFGFQKMAGIDHRVGTDGPWEVKRVLGKVPVQADGSALFEIPAKTPISLQPLDANGQAVALMRSWMTAMPGEVVSCVGCHEQQSQAPQNASRLALRAAPTKLEAWRGPALGFSFAREVQPVLDQYCVGCHDGQPEPGGRRRVDLRAEQGEYVVYEHGNPQLKRVPAFRKADLVGKYAGVFEPAYIALRELVRVGGLESDLHVLPPKEFAADTSELVQMLRKGHHGVALDQSAWDRLLTWIDLNAPCQGTWSETYRIPGQAQPDRRRELRQRYGGLDEDPETLGAGPPPDRVKPLPPPPIEDVVPDAPVCEGWPFDAEEARRRQGEGDETVLQLDLGDGLFMTLRRVPAGRFVMGSATGDVDERPLRVVEVERGFWIGACEVSNGEYRRFDPSHDSRFEHRSSWIFDEEYLGWTLNREGQPVVRVSWDQAMAFCRWMSERTGRRVTLPSEEQWEYACRAGTDSALSFGQVTDDFAPYGNLADVNLRRLAWEGWRPRSPDLVPRVEGVDDGALVTVDVASYRPNAWGLYDMHGNVTEWTRSDYAAKGGSASHALTGKVVRGGSWRDRPHRCRSAFRLAYPAYQPVFNVGFRVVVEDEDTTEDLAANP